MSTGSTGRSAIALGVVVTLLGGISAAALAQTDEPATGDQQLTWTLGSEDDIDSFNPFVAVSSGYTIFAMTYEYLLSYDAATLERSPGLAESWETSDDGLTWTFHMREGVVWHDGEPLTANDVAYTYNRTIDDHVGAWFSYLRLVDSVTAPDDSTVVITTRKPAPGILSILIPILPEHIWSDISKEDAKTVENIPIVGSGPFELVEYQPGQFARLEANQDYWGGAPQIDEIIYRVFNNQDAAVEALKSGEIDAIDSIEPNLFESLQGNDTITTHAADIISFDEIAFNAGALQGDGHPALQDVRVRQAIAHAIDKQTLVDRVVLGYGTVGSTIVTPAAGAYHYEPTQDEVLDFDIAEANQILDDAGYLDTDDDGVREMPNGGDPLEFRYYVRSQNNDSVRASQFISGWLEQIGIATEISSLNDNKLTDVIIDGTYDMFQWGWFGDVDPDFILSVMTCGQRPELDANGNNVGGIWSDSYYCNADFDRMYLEQKTILDSEQRREVIHEMQRMVYLDAPYVVLWYDKDLQAYRNDTFTGYVPSPAPNGDLFGILYAADSFTSIRPVEAEGGGGTPAVQREAKGISAGVWIGIVVGVIVLLAAFALVRRRRVSEEDRA
jgi:peptide/nickel transport system substrate-binding protein